ncbi:unnamed protein product [Mycena citricolor]|uniref:SEP domain-containing protein n=1 Tax=Mycena citricolor TaxID=2018698 RepID=A0AAD2HVT8_9AGAR|nr:unnamed protein product [Mycena citricolor]CAK5282036.1 unnamed protein product [Mycena citricolor]
MAKPHGERGEGAQRLQSHDFASDSAGGSASRVSGELARLEPGSPVPSDSEKPALRTLTFWRTGFTVGDAGSLMRYDEPANASLLAAINAGKAPPALFDVRPGQPLEVRVSDRTTEEYEGSGQVTEHNSGLRHRKPGAEMDGRE